MQYFTVAEDLEYVVLVSLTRIRSTPPSAIKMEQDTRNLVPSPSLDTADRDPRGLSAVLPSLPYPLAPRVDTTWYSSMSENDWHRG